MIKLLRILCTSLLLTASTVAMAQVHTLAGFSNFSKKGLTPLYLNGEVKGYTLFYKADRASKNLDNFGLELYDQNLQKINTAQIQKDGYYTMLLRTIFNGKALGLYFYNNKTWALELEVYDTSLKKIASKVFDDVPFADRQMIGAEYSGLYEPGNRPIRGLNLYAVPEKGFIKHGFTRRNKGFVLEMYDNNLELKWSAQTDKQYKGYETFIVNEVTSEYVLATITRNKSRDTKTLDFYLVAFDVNTGEKVLDVPVEKGADQQLALNTFRFDPVKKEFLAVGEYFKPNKKLKAGKSEGVFIKAIGLNGKERSGSFYTWQKDIKPLVQQDEKKSMEKAYSTFMHKIVPGADGKMHIIGEQYKIRPNVTGAFFYYVGFGSSRATAVVGDMTVYTLAPDQQLEKVELFAKDKSKIKIYGEARKLLNGRLDQALLLRGDFDHQFTQEDARLEGFNMAYFNYKKGKKENFKERTLVNVLGTGSSKLTLDKLDLSASKKLEQFVFPAKPGYVLLVQNNLDDKKIDMKLVKLSR